MKKKVLNLLFFIIATNLSYGQIGGLTNYSFSNESEVKTSDGDLSIYTSSDGMMTINQGSRSLFKYHGSHDIVMSSGNTFSFNVAPTATTTFTVCEYSANGATLTVNDVSDQELGVIDAESKGDVDVEARTFAFSRSSQAIKATLNPEGSVNINAVSIDNAGVPEVLANGITEVWDFGAEQLDTSSYINRLDVATINAWYDTTVSEGSSSNTLPAFTTGILEFAAGGSDRLRTSNTSLTRYDENVGSSIYTGRVYVNASASTSQYMSLSLNEDDEVSVVAISQNGNGLLNFVYVANPEAQTDQLTSTITPTAYSFVAKEKGVYQIFDTKDKPSYYRISRNSANYATISGNVTVPVGIPSNYGLVFTNEAGKQWNVEVVGGVYTVDLPSGYNYHLSLSNANGYVIRTLNTVAVSGNATNDITVEQITLNEVTGVVTGLSDNLAHLILTYTSVDQSKIFIPEVSLNTTTGEYSVLLEPNTEYTITAAGVNDYGLNSSSITITGDQTVDVAFSTKPTYTVTITSSNLTAVQLADLSLTFTNINEDGYVYEFSSVDNIVLRDGTYSITYGGMNAYQLELGLNSNLTINGSAISKELFFNTVTLWSFDDEYISNATAYKGLMFTGGVTVRGGSGNDLLAGANAEIIIPVKVGEKVLISHYYAANFSIDGGATIENTTGSTSQVVTSEYIYKGATDGTVTVSVGATSYFTQIEVVKIVAYSSVITVGVDKDYQTIHAALDAIAEMERTNDQRVAVEIDPGNYEEMLVIDQPNVSFVNASLLPCIALQDAGVNIDANAVRITSYYGYGYDYYSMKDNQKWDADVLRVNKENGYFSYENESGTTNGSFWNATVVVYADGFEAKNIIFENSFNQYVSQKESEDIVVEKTTGGKGVRPTDTGNTSVQQKTFIERAAALAIKGGDKMILNNCRLVGRQDVFYGGNGSRVVAYKGNMMGGTDYIFGGMTVVFYKSDMAMNTSEDSNDVSYITAGQQKANERGYLMYECKITSAIPGVDNAASYRSKPGYFGRCWSGANCEVIFYNTTIETSNNPSYDGQSLINPAGWIDGLGGPSIRVGEYGTIEMSGEDNSESRVSGAEVSGDWGVTVLSSPVLRDDSTAITTQNFTNGSDGWDPIPALVSCDLGIAEVASDSSTEIASLIKESSIQVYAIKSEVVLFNVIDETTVKVYNTQGVVVKTFKTNENTRFTMPKGCWIVNVTDPEGAKSVKVLTL